MFLCFVYMLIIIGGQHDCVCVCVCVCVSVCVCVCGWVRPQCVRSLLGGPVEEVPPLDQAEGRGSRHRVSTALRDERPHINHREYFSSSYVSTSPRDDKNPF